LVFEPSILYALGILRFISHLDLRNSRCSRDNSDSLKDELSALGADYVFTYDELTDKSVSSRIKELTKDKPIKLFLNCVGGRDTTAMAKLVGPDAHLVTYGAMSKQPLSLPASLFIFKNLTTHGFWQNQWYQTHSRSEREQLVARLTSLISEKKVCLIS
jgi:NADPH:quinone reductase-like Zn-dependent oxidoreductase